MRERFRSSALLALAAAATWSILTVAPASAAKTCESQVNKAAAKLATTRIKAAGKACKKSPGGTCFAVTLKSNQLIAAKRLKKCDAAAIQALFGGKCVSRDATCKPSAMATADDVAACLNCGVQAGVNCLTAATFAGASVPANCVGSPSGAFLDGQE